MRRESERERKKALLLTTQQKDLLAVVAFQVQIVNGKESPVHALAITCYAALVEHTLWRWLHDELVNVANDITLGFGTAATQTATAVRRTIAAAVHGAIVLVGRANARWTHWRHARYIPIGVVILIEGVIEGLLLHACRVGTLRWQWLLDNSHGTALLILQLVRGYLLDEICKVCTTFEWNSPWWRLKLTLLVDGAQAAQIVRVVATRIEVATDATDDDDAAASTGAAVVAAAQDLIGILWRTNELHWAIVGVQLATVASHAGHGPRADLQITRLHHAR